MKLLASLLLHSLYVILDTSSSCLPLLSGVDRNSQNTKLELYTMTTTIDVEEVVEVS